MKRLQIITNIDVTIDIDDDAEINDVLREMTYGFHDNTGKANVDQAHMLDYEIVE